MVFLNDNGYFLVSVFYIIVLSVTTAVLDGRNSVDLRISRCLRPSMNI